MWLQRLALILLFGGALLVGAPAQTEQACVGLNCTPAATEPFTHVYSFGTSSSFAGNGAGATDQWAYIVQTQQMDADTHWAVLRTGSITALSCNYNINTETTAGTISFEVREPASDNLVETVTTAGVAYYDWVQTYAAGTYAVVAGEGLDLYINMGTFEGNMRRLYCLVEVSGTL